jgi:hypothetical protein
MYVYMYECMNDECMSANVHMHLSHTYIHTQTHTGYRRQLELSTYIHTYIHTYIQVADDNVPCVRGRRIGVLKDLVLDAFSDGHKGGCMLVYACMYV